MATLFLENGGIGRIGPPKNKLPGEGQFRFNISIADDSAQVIRLHICCKFKIAFRILIFRQKAFTKTKLWSLNFLQKNYRRRDHLVARGRVPERGCGLPEKFQKQHLLIIQ